MFFSDIVDIDLVGDDPQNPKRFKNPVGKVNLKIEAETDRVTIEEI